MVGAQGDNPGTIVLFVYVPSVKVAPANLWISNRVDTVTRAIAPITVELLEWSIQSPSWMSLFAIVVTLAKQTLSHLRAEGGKAALHTSCRRNEVELLPIRTAAKRHDRRPAVSSETLGAESDVEIRKTFAIRSTLSAHTQGY